MCVQCCHIHHTTDKETKKEKAENGEKECKNGDGKHMEFSIFVIHEFSKTEK